ncbi:hypothetical protein LshimejAT787_0408100 [Lyophyllum shimeji]|uniref:C2H2-type domain-containing protein n=1 Tax=Lyophyllum shimeji TaxID=47721 RepID=A0A9P3PLQ0_LYOSH|nr:hypothetical protein LshimejAT787_0408100 [Lyophyllum shimeji]
MSYPSGFSFEEFQESQQFTSSSCGRGMETAAGDEQRGPSRYPHGGLNPMLSGPMVDAVLSHSTPQYVGYPPINEYHEDGMSRQLWNEQRPYSSATRSATHMLTSFYLNELPLLPALSTSATTPLYPSAYPCYPEPGSHHPYTSSIVNYAPHGTRRDARPASANQIRAEPDSPLVYESPTLLSRPGDPIRCPYAWCPSTFTRPRDLERHLATALMHNSTKTGSDASKRCRKCGKEFSRADARKRHELKNSCGKRKHNTR